MSEIKLTSLEQYDDSPHTVIVGGGLAGLSAAWHLSKIRPWWKIAVIEQEKEIGGLARTWDIAGVRVDYGPHRWYTELEEIKKLENVLLPQDALIRSTRKSSMVLHGSVIDYPPNPLNVFKQLGISKCLRLGISALMTKMIPALGEPSNFADAMRAVYGNAACTMITDKYAWKVWKTDPKALSAEVARNRVSKGKGIGRPESLSEITYCRGGIDAISNHIAGLCKKSGVKILTDMSLKAVMTRENTDTITDIAVQDGLTGESYVTPVDNVISTIPITSLSQYLIQMKSNEKAEIAAAELQYLNMILIVVEINKPRLSENTWMYFPDDDVMFNRMFEPVNFDNSMAKDDTKGCIVFDITSRKHEEPWLLSNDEIMEKMYHQITETGIISADEILTMYLLRIPNAYPLYTIGFEKYRKTLLLQCTEVNNLITTGRQGLFSHNNMDHSILTGIKAAECLADGAKVGENWYTNYLPQFEQFRIVD
ncbi:MAG: FAD-dependent oxidoreductase [Candidatus Sumerlaeales bacterium]|nr:FAD-dependent oxidoreductase [Candidatus Sumerlaeales bacterium]